MAKPHRSVEEIKALHAEYVAKGGENDLVRFAEDIGVKKEELLLAVPEVDLDADTVELPELEAVEEEAEEEAAEEEELDPAEDFDLV